MQIEPELLRQQPGERGGTGARIGQGLVEPVRDAENGMGVPELRQTRRRFRPVRLLHGQFEPQIRHGAGGG
ncbi:hypothetical protein [uncultured Victivallis sp.]|uniref:hypothetical protein n=1 Tax=uncultured Victivallis sp. TaxID=354118 RepID=UPI0025830F17|nr:hypothetical protein [uncultured Victivallis sp.]